MSASHILSFLYVRSKVLLNFVLAYVPRDRKTRRGQNCRLCLLFYFSYSGKENEVNKNVRRRKHFIFLTEQLWALWPRAGNLLENAYAIFDVDLFGSIPHPLSPSHCSYHNPHLFLRLSSLCINKKLCSVPAL